MFKIGDRVFWESNDTKKEGVVLEVVESGEQLKYSSKNCPFLDRFEKYNDKKRWRHSRLSDGTVRFSESYLVAVKDKYLYWPVTSKLRKVIVD